MSEPLDPRAAGEIRKRSRTFFEAELDRYKDVSPPSIQDGAQTRRLLQSLPVPPGSRLVDIGCGTGIVASHLKRLFPQAGVCGLDISPKVIARAQELDRTGSIDFVVATESELPFRDSVFASAVCRFSLHHYPDLPAHFREVRRVLKKKGIYLIVEVLPEAGRFQTMLNDVFAAAERNSAGHVAYYSLEDFMDLLAPAKLKLRSVQPIPLQLKIGKYLTHCREIRETPASFRKRISFEEGDDWFSVRLPAAGLFAEAE